MRWSPFLITHEFSVEDDFEEAAGEDFDRYVPVVLAVKPCEMMMIKVTSPVDFTDNWIGTQAYGLQLFAFVDSESNEAEEEEDVEYAGYYIVRVPCNARPGATFSYGEYDDGSSEEEAGLDLYYSYNADSSLAQPFDYTVRMELTIKDYSDGGLGGGSAFTWVVALGLVGGAVYYFVL